MTNRPDVDVLSELGAALRVEPSPDFAARVRASVEGKPIRAWWFGDWRLPLAGAAVALVVFLGAAAWFGDAASQPAAQPASVATEAPETKDPPRALVPVPPATSPLTRRSVRNGRRVVRTGSASTGPEILVPPDQAIAIRRLLAAFRAGRVPVVSDLRNMDEVSADLPPISMIEIPLITIDPLPGPAGGDRERNPS